jgi:hypothetical protein
MGRFATWPLMMGGLLVAAAAAGQPLGCPAPGRPLLEVVGATVFEPPQPQPNDFRGGALLCTDGTTIETGVVLAPDGLSPLLPPETVAIWRSRVPNPEMTDLAHEMAEARIGHLRDCTLDSTAGFTYARRITWHGRLGRRNTFRVLSNDFTVPACGSPLNGLLNAIEGALFAAREAPTREILTIPGEPAELRSPAR